ncbi:MAG TPA: endonuclease III [Phototrophicaceae bacterium]|nr:endonuclease III [Phototrophicaceae bacterium]
MQRLDPAIANPESLTQKLLSTMTLTHNEFVKTIPDFERRQAKFAPVSARLREVYGKLEWIQTQDAMDELISFILSQNTSATNRDRGFFALKERYPTWQEVMDAPVDELIDTIRMAGLANQKSPRIQNVLRHILAERGAFDLEFLRDMSVEEGRSWLMAMDGIGPKTAAIVLCFAFNMPAFPVDTHIHRVGMRVGFLPDKISADKAHPIMEALIPPDKHYEFHIQLIRHGRTTCKAQKPLCERCPISHYCDYYAATRTSEA